MFRNQFDFAHICFDKKQVGNKKLPTRMSLCLILYVCCYCLDLDGVVLIPLGGDFKYSLFSPLLGEDEPNLTNIFQMGWNHQLVLIN